MPDALWVVLGAAAGAPLRYLAGLLWNDGRLPLGTLVVNVAGSFVLGVVVTAGLPDWAVAALGAGFCGGLTTYSAFAFETVRLAESGLRWAVANAALNVTLGLAAAWAGVHLTG